MQVVTNTIFPIAFDFVNLLNTMAQMQPSASVSSLDNAVGSKELTVMKPGSNQVLCFCSMLENGQLNVREFAMETKKSFGNCCELEELNTIDTNYLITSVKHANKKDVWLVAKHLQNNEFKSFLLTESNVSSIPVSSFVGKVFTSNLFLNSVLKSNSATNRIVFKSGISNTITFYDFNPITGKVSNAKFVESYNGKSFAISNDGNKLYVSKVQENQERVYELDFKFGGIFSIVSNEKLLKTISNDVIKNLSITEDNRLLVTTNNPLNFTLIFPSNLSKNSNYSRTEITKECGCNEKATIGWDKPISPTWNEWKGGTGPVIDVTNAQWEENSNLLVGRDSFRIQDYPLLSTKFAHSTLVQNQSEDTDVYYSFNQTSDGISFQFSDENGVNVSLSVNTPVEFDPKSISYIRNVYPTTIDSIGNIPNVWVEIETIEGEVFTYSGVTFPAFVDSQAAFCRLQEEDTFNLLDEYGNYLDLETCEVYIPQDSKHLIHEFNYILTTENGEHLSWDNSLLINNY
jgi:hypothetical protein